MLDDILDCRLVFTSISSNQSQLELTVFPNPVKNAITVQINSYQFLPLFVEINNIQGEVITKYDLIEHNSELDISELNSRIYILKVVGKYGEIVKSKKIIKKQDKINQI